MHKEDTPLSENGVSKTKCHRPCVNNVKSLWFVKLGFAVQKHEEVELVSKLWQEKKIGCWNYVDSCQKEVRVMFCYALLKEDENQAA